MVRSLGVFDALGVPVEVRASEPLASILAGVLGDLPAADGFTSRVRLTARRHRAGDWSVWEDRRIRIDQTDEAVALHVLFIALNELVAERSAATDLVLHASAASIDGQVVAFAGRGGAGKSRLAMWAAQHGDGFVCEDVCAVDDDGRVRPFHRPAGLHPDGAAELGVAIPEGPFGWVFPFPVGECATLTPGGPLGMIVLAQRSRGAPGVSRIAPPDALARLSPMTIATPGSEAAMFRRLERTVRRVPVVELTYRDVREVPDLMRAELAP